MAIISLIVLLFFISILFKDTTSPFIKVQVSPPSLHTLKPSPTPFSALPPKDPNREKTTVPPSIPSLDPAPSKGVELGKRNDPTPTAASTPRPTTKSQKGFIYDSNISFYGPGFYGRRTACGLALTTNLLGVAHKTLPCGTKVTFSYKGVTITVPVVDRGPYVKGRQWDLTGGACVVLKHCFTGNIYYRIEK